MFSLSVLELINKSLDSLTQESRREVLEKSLKISLDFSEFVDFSISLDIWSVESV